MLETQIFKYFLLLRQSEHNDTQPKDEMCFFCDETHCTCIYLWERPCSGHICFNTCLHCPLSWFHIKRSVKIKSSVLVWKHVQQLKAKWSLCLWKFWYVFSIIAGLQEPSGPASLVNELVETLTSFLTMILFALLSAKADCNGSMFCFTCSYACGVS